MEPHHHPLDRKELNSLSTQAVRLHTIAPLLAVTLATGAGATDCGVERKPVGSDQGVTGVVLDRSDVPNQRECRTVETRIGDRTARRRVCPTIHMLDIKRPSGKHTTIHVSARVSDVCWPESDYPDCKTKTKQ
jgi:hypothetical protein